jgi:hypothetical protein
MSPLIPHAAGGFPLWLGASQPVPVISDASVLASVGAIPGGKPLSMVALPRPTVDVEPAQLLRELSIAYSPPMTGFAYWLVAKWALARYFWIFEPPAPGFPLRMTAASTNLPTRQKGLLAEDMGVAFTRLLAPIVSGLPAGGSIDWVNGELALGGAAVGAFGVVPLAGAGAGPDYFGQVVAPGGGAAGTPLAFEAKGTTGVSNWVTQMRHAAVQLTTAALDDGSGAPYSMPQGFIFSTQLSVGGVKVRLLDPEGDWAGPIGNRRDSERPEQLETVADEDGVRVVRDPAGFRRDLADLANAQLLGYAGRFAESARKVPVRARAIEAERVVPDAPLARRETQYGDYSGLEITVGAGHASGLRLFYGLENNVLGALVEDDPAAAVEPRRHLAGRIQALDRPTWTDVDEARQSIRAYGLDGTLLELGAL